MKASETPSVVIEGVSTYTATGTSGQEIEVDITFAHKVDYENSFKAMADKISDETLIEILKERDEEYIAEDYQ